MNRKQALVEVERKIIRTATVLDIGCGIRPQTYFKARTHICVEPYLPYIQRLRQSTTDEANYIFICCDWKTATSVMLEKSIDTVFILDMIEHLPKHEGNDLLGEAERIARKQIVIFTPLGFMPQDHPDGKDRWGMAGGYWQTHRSGWETKDFSEDWELIVCEDFHKESQYGTLEKPFGAFWAIRTFDRVRPKINRLRFNFGFVNSILQAEENE